MARDRARLRDPDRPCRPVPSAQHDRVRRAARSERAIERVLCADVRPPRPGVRRRRLHAGRACGLVPERRQAARIVMPILDTIAGNRIPGHRPWPRVIVREDGWRFAAQQCAAGQWTLLGLWGDAGAVHMAVLDERSADVAVLTLECKDGTFPSVGAVHPPAIRLERAIRDLYGLEPAGALDTRPWLDLGFWGVAHPLGARREAPASRAPYAFLPVEGENLHQIPVGPVHAGIIEPGHFRFPAHRETRGRRGARTGHLRTDMCVARTG